MTIPAVISCGTARRLAWESPEASVLPVERGRAVAHLATCEECRRFQADMALLRQAAVHLAPDVPTPEFVARLRRATITAPRRRRWTRGVLVGLAAAATALVVTRWPGRAESVLTERIVAQQAQLLAEPGIEHADAAVVQAWLNRRLPQPVHVPTFENARLLGAALVQINDLPAAVMRFQVGGQFITYTVAPARDALAAAPAVIGQRRDTAAVVAWRDATLQHVWVGAIPAQHLTAFARSCAEQARSAMRTSGQSHGDRRPQSTSSPMESLT